MNVSVFAAARDRSRAVCCRGRDWTTRARAFDHQFRGELGSSKCPGALLAAIKAGKQSMMALEEAAFW